MAVWPGGPCPDCGEEMPANCVRCRKCRAVLDAKRAPKKVGDSSLIKKLKAEAKPIPVVDVGGFFVECSGCHRELRVEKSVYGKQVTCIHCQSALTIQFSGDDGVLKVAAYSGCPHCKREIRAAPRFCNQNVLCKYCDQPLRITDETA